MTGVEALGQGALHYPQSTPPARWHRPTERLGKDGPHPLDAFRRVIELNLISFVQRGSSRCRPHGAQRARGRRARA